MLDAAGASYLINPLGRRLSEDELCEMIGDAEALIAGTEPITEKVMEAAPSLKLISRVGIGLDNVDLLAARRRGIDVSYTPDAPAPAVADLTIGLMLALLRDVHLANADMHRGEWKRRMGRRLSKVSVGIIGVGRIGLGVMRRLTAFSPERVLANDISPNPNQVEDLQIEWVSKEIIFREADVISLHVPLTPQTYQLIAREQLLMMKHDALLINTARGGLISEDDLAVTLSEGHLGGVALDVFAQEPYSGPLVNFDKCLLTSHMGSMSEDCRTQMEIEASEEVIRFLNGQQLKQTVPEEEYASQAQARSSIFPR